MESKVHKIVKETEVTRLVLSRADQTLSSLSHELSSVSKDIISTCATARITQMTAEKAQDAAEKTQVQLHDFLSRFGQFTIAYSEAIHGPPSTQRIGVELVQKPSFLQEQLDDLKGVSLHDFSYNSSISRIRSRQCGCPMRTKWRSFAKRGPFWSSTKAQQTHLPSCKYVSKPAWAVEVGMAFVARCLSFAVQLSFRATKGGGAFSLSPNIAVTRHVDRQTSQAFTLIDKILINFSRKQLSDGTYGLMGTPLGYTQYSDDRDMQTFFFLKWDMPGLERHLQRLLMRLEKLFESSQASPLDTDLEGRTLLHISSSLSQLCRTKFTDSQTLLEGNCCTFNTY